MVASNHIFKSFAPTVGDRSIIKEPWLQKLGVQDALVERISPQERMFRDNLGNPNIVDLSVNDSSRLSEIGVNRIKSFLGSLDQLMRVETDSSPTRIAQEDQIALKNMMLFLNRSKGRKINEVDDGDIDALELEISKTLTDIRHNETDGEVQYIEFDDIFGDFTEEQLELLGKHIFGIELNTGCSVGCPQCNVGALKQQRRYLSWNAINEIIDRWGSNFEANNVILYDNTDPLDWQGVDDNGNLKNYEDIQELVANKCGYRPEITTAVPRGKEALARRLWDEPQNFMRISPSNVNVTRLKNAGFWSGATLDDYQRSLNRPPGSRSYVVGSSSGGNYDKAKPDSDGNTHLEIKAGANYDFKSFRPSIACQQGVLITTDGVYNAVVSSTTPAVPNGGVKYQVDPQNMLVIPNAFTPETDKNNFKPTFALNSDGWVSLPLTDQQCFEAIYQVLIKTIVDNKLLSLENPKHIDKFLDPFHQFSRYLFRLVRGESMFRVVPEAIDMNDQSLRAEMVKSAEAWNSGLGQQLEELVAGKRELRDAENLEGRKMILEIDRLVGKSGKDLAYEAMIIVHELKTAVGFLLKEVTALNDSERRVLKEAVESLDLYGGDIIQQDPLPDNKIPLFMKIYTKLNDQVKLESNQYSYTVLREALERYRSYIEHVGYNQIIEMMKEFYREHGLPQCQQVRNIEFNERFIWRQISKSLQSLSRGARISARLAVESLEDELRLLMHIMFLDPGNEVVDDFITGEEANVVKLCDEADRMVWKIRNSLEYPRSTATQPLVSLAA